MSSVVIVPGMAVRSFVIPAADGLAAAGHRVRLMPAPGWRGVPDRLAVYGEWLAAELRYSGEPVDVLVGLSAGTQAAAVTATQHRIGHLLLVSPTVPPERRSLGRLLGSWLHGDHHPDSPTLAQQVPDWRRAGARRIYRCVASALEVRLEEVLGGVDAPVTLVHAGWDNLTSFDFVAKLAVEHDLQLVELPAAPHSWPIGDEDRFVALVSSLAVR